MVPHQQQGWKRCFINLSITMQATWHLRPAQVHQVGSLADET